jgi:hypothetical protein
MCLYIVSLSPPLVRLLTLGDGDRRRHWSSRVWEVGFLRHGVCRIRSRYLRRIMTQWIGLERGCASGVLSGSLGECDSSSV